MHVLDIVPIEDRLRIEARVRAADIGFLHVGQSAKVNITAYNYPIYGDLSGEVEFISADTNKDEQNNPY